MTRTRNARMADEKKVVRIARLMSRNRVGRRRASDRRDEVVRNI